MIYSDFLTAVGSCLGPEANRRGLEAFRDQHTRNCIVDLQRYVPSYRLSNVTTFNQADLTVESQAMVGQFPPNAKPQAFYIYSNAPGDDPNCKRYRLDYYPWERRKDILCGRLDFRTWWGGCFGGLFPGSQGFPNCPNPPPPPPTNPSCPNPWSFERRAYVYSISPHQTSFIIYPPLSAFSSLLLVWDGYKINFSPNDYVPFPQEASEAVASYLLWKIHRLIDKDVALAQEDEKDYLNARRALVREYRDSESAEGHDDEYLSNIVAPPGESLITAGAQAIPILQAITAIAGTTANCLQSIQTAGLTVPQTVMVIIGGLNQLWTLKVGTDATDVPNGICQPLDWATSGFVWYSSTA